MKVPRKGNPETGERYSRQTTLPEVGSSGQAALARARVLVIGCGGLASPVCSYLAAAGVGKVGIIDDDEVELSNLPRQILFDEDDIGKGKVEAAKRHLIKKCAGIQVEVHRLKFLVENALDIASEYDVLVDCSDNFSTKYLASDVAVKLGIPLVYGSVTGFDGQFGVFDGREGSCVRCFLPEKEFVGVRNCQEAGVLGAAVGVIGAWQALECLKVILGKAGCASASPRFGQISVLNLLESEQSAFFVPKRSDCICQNGDGLEIVAAVEQACALEVSTVSWAEVESLGRVAILDVREADEFQQGCISGSSHWPLSKLERRDWPELGSGATKCILVCAKGARSARAGQLLSSAFPEVKFYSLRGGLEKLPEYGMPKLAPRAEGKS